MIGDQQVACSAKSGRCKVALNNLRCAIARARTHKLFSQQWKMGKQRDLHARTQIFHEFVPLLGRARIDCLGEICRK